MSPTLTATLPEKQTCSGCPNWQQSNRTPNVGFCPLYDEPTFGHDVAGDNCPLQDEQGKAQNELNRLIDEQANAIAPEYRLAPIDVCGLPEFEVWVGEHFVGMVSFAPNMGWFAIHTDRPFATENEAARSLAIWHSRKPEPQLETEEGITATVAYCSKTKYRSADSSPYISHRIESLDGDLYWKSLDEEEALVVGTTVKLIPYLDNKGREHHHIKVLSLPETQPTQPQKPRVSRPVAQVQSTATDSIATIEADIERF